MLFVPLLKKLVSKKCVLQYLQFVNFTSIMSKNASESEKETAFALAALMEIPIQYKAAIELGLLGYVLLSLYNLEAALIHKLYSFITFSYMFALCHFDGQKAHDRKSKENKSKTSSSTLCSSSSA